VLAIAPTGSGKTLAAFLYALDQLFREGDAPAADTVEKKTTRILYISPIKALGTDIQRNLQIPLQGISEQRKKHGAPEVVIRVAMRTGDTSTQERATLVRRPPDILITTPESLYLMLTSRARETLRGVETVIVDEVHAVAGNKRGAHLALSLERLDALLARPAQRIGLSATVRSPSDVAQFLGAIVRSPWLTHRRFAIRIFVLWCPLPIWMTSSPPAPVPAKSATRAEKAPSGRILNPVSSTRYSAINSTIVFTNSRGLAEKLTARLNELYASRMAEAPEEQSDAAHYVSSSGATSNRAQTGQVFIARSHHGSVSKEQRAITEQALKSGELRCVVATSSLELGIDMGAVDLVIQIASPFLLPAAYSVSAAPDIRWAVYRKPFSIRAPGVS
jgi:ATP-dependent Lhr-like helicase